jgi:arabinofuranosyltransferase
VRRKGRTIQPDPKYRPAAVPAATPRAYRPLPSFWLAAIPILAFLLVLHYRSASGPGYPLDDSWIHLAFARHLAHGQGFGINPGQWSTGSTSPLWTLMLAAGLVFRAGHAAWPWLLATIALCVAGLTGALLVRRLLTLRGDEGTPAGGIASLAGGLLVVSSPWLVWSTAGAMETPLFVALLLLAWAERLREDLPLSEGGRALAFWGVPAGLAIVARPEGAIFAVLLALCSRLRSGIANLITAAAIYAPYGIYCLSVSGHPWPSTFYAKTTQTFAGMPDLAYLARAAALLADLMPALVALLIAGAAVLIVGTGLRRTSPGRLDFSERLARWRAFLPGVLFVIALPLAYATMGRSFLFAGVAGNFGRYLFPLAPFLAILGAAMLVLGAARIRVRVRRGWVLLALGVPLIWNGIAAANHAAFFAHNVRDIDAMQVEMANRLARDLPAGSLVASNDVGALAYFTDLRVLDLVGIVSPEVQQALFPLRRLDRAERHKALFQLIVKLKPAAIAVFPEWYPEILQSLQPLLRPLEQIRVPGNITSAQSELDAWRIEWPAGAPVPAPAPRLPRGLR